MLVTAKKEKVTTKKKKKCQVTEEFFASLLIKRAQTKTKLNWNILHGSLITLLLSNQSIRQNSVIVNCHYDYQ